MEDRSTWHEAERWAVEELERLIAEHRSRWPGLLLDESSAGIVLKALRAAKDLIIGD